jgi:hypothetical protein
MSETTTPTDPQTSRRPSEIVLNLLATLLAPMFLGVTGGDIALARMAAIETVGAYRAGTVLDLIAVAQIVGYGLAALGSLSLSMEDDLSLSMILRLRGSANACSRSAEQNRRALGKVPINAPIPHHETTAAEPSRATPDPDPQTPPGLHMPELHTPELHTPEVHIDNMAARILAEESLARLRRPAEKISQKIRQQAPEQTPAQIQAPPSAQTATPAPTEKRHHEMWAIAMVKESSEITAGIQAYRPPNAPPPRSAPACSAAPPIGC